MKWLLILGLILMAGPLRRWASWDRAFLAAVALAAVCCWVVGAVVFGVFSGDTIVPPGWAFIAVIALAFCVPALLRKIGKKGKD